MTKTLRVALGLLLCLVLCVCLLPAAWADGQGAETFAAGGSTSASGTWGNLKWTLNSSGTLTVTGRGPMDEQYDAIDIWGAYCDDIVHVKLSSGVTTIAYSAFENCGNLTSVELPEGLTSIGDYAFSGCGSLTSINIPSTVTTIGQDAFHDCYGLTSAGPIGSGCHMQLGWTSSVPDSAFGSCNYLASVTIPEGVTSIGYGAFAGCGSLTSVELPEGVTSIGREAFGNCNSLTSINIPEGVTSIGDRTFFYCNSLTSINIPEGVTSIGDGTFSNCNSLTSINIPSTVTTIAASAFSYCSSLTRVTIPDGVTAIGGGAFLGCYGLTRVTIPASVTSIGKGVFMGCTRLTSAGPIGSGCRIQFGWIRYIPGNAFANSSIKSVEFPEGVTTIGWGSFLFCGDLPRVDIPATVTTIDAYAFHGCGGLTSVTIPASVTTIGEQAFSECGNLTSVELPEGLTTISDYAFASCNDLTSIDIPDGVTTIGEYAFSGCSNLASVTIPASVTSVGFCGFIGCSNLRDVYYGGTENQWQQIRFDNGNDELTEAAIHYVESDPFQELKAAIANGDTYFNMDNCGDVVFTEDLRIPQNLKVEGNFTKVIVPENVHLTVLGELWVDDFAILGNCNVQEGGKVCVINLDANGYQYFEGEVTGGVLNIGDGTEVITVETHYGEGAHLYFNEIHYGEDSRISRNHNVVNATELSGAIAAAQQPHDSHIAEFIRVMFPWTISADMTIPEGISQDNLQVFIMKRLTVNRGATLTVDGVLNCSSPVVFNGAVVNNGRIGVPNVQDLSSGAIVKVNGSYSGYGDLAVHDSEELADSYFSGVDLSQFRRIIRPGYVYYDAIRNDVFQALKAAIANGATYFNMIDCDTVVFTEDITIPSTMHLEARDTLIIIPNGVTMTVEGFNNLGFVTVQPGGHVTVNDTGKANFAVHQGLIFDSVDQFTVNGNMHIDHKVWEDELRNLDLGPNAGVEVAFNVDNNDELLAALNANLDFPNGQFVKWICIGFDCTLTDDFSIDGFDLSVGGSWTDGQPKGSLTIPAGKTLTIVDRLRTEDAPIYLQGIMVNHGQFFVEKIKSTGALLIRSGNGSYYGGDIVVHADMDKRDACLEGFGTSLYKRYVGEWGTSYGVDNSGIFTALKQAIARGESDFNMRNCGTVLFAESITIPNTTKVHASGTEIVIPDGVTLTVENYCRVGTLTVQSGGHVTVSDMDGAHLRVDDALNYNNVNQFTVNRYMVIGLSAWRRDLENLNFGEKGGLTVSSWAYNDSELAAALAGKPKLQNDKIRNRIVICYDCTLVDDMIVDDFNLAVEDSGSLTIPAGKTLMCLNKVEAQDGPIYLQGRMISVGYGQLSLQWEESAAALLNISGEGFYAGKQIHVYAPKDRRDACISGLDMSKVGKIINPDFTAYFPPIEVVLPDGLTALGGEAFANDSFHTVYIPAGVTSIDPDAFSGTDVAIIFGVVGSYAEEYAADSGIPFLRLPSWYDVHDQQFVIDHTA